MNDKSNLEKVDQDNYEKILKLRITKEQYFKEDNEITCLLKL